MTDETQQPAADVTMPADQPGALTDELGAGEELIRPHAAGTRGITLVPGSSFHTGKFGRLFRNLPRFDVPESLIDQLAEVMVEPDEPISLEVPADVPAAPTDNWAGGLPAPSDGQEPLAKTPLDNPNIPAGYTYLGQFLDHDITFDPTSSLTRLNDPDSLHDFRTPRLDLDSVYGRGPDDQPYLYDQSPSRRGFLAVDKRDHVTDLPRVNERQALKRAGKVDHRVALVGDPRNDENILVAQMHLTFIHFHNRVLEDLHDGKHVDHLQSTSATDRFAEAQRIVRWHYQYLVLTDFLTRTVGEPMRQAVLPPVQDVTGPMGGALPQTVKLQFYTPHGGHAFMPIEFSVAAYRFGHSQIRPRYRLNTLVRDVAIFMTPPTLENELQHLGGHREFPSFWQIEWRRFFNMNEVAGADPSVTPDDLQFTRKIDTRIAGPLSSLPADIVTVTPSLTKRNLLRGKMLSLPSGQDVARRMGTQVLSASDLGLPGTVTPLWPYILAEATHEAEGKHLGPVGGRIVAEVLAGLVVADSTSYLNVEAGWKPFLGTTAGRFTMPDLLGYTGFGLATVDNTTV